MCIYMSVYTIIHTYMHACNRGKLQVFGTLGLGDTLDIENVVESSPVSFTATALAIVDVMTVNIRKIVQNPKELPKESFHPLIDGNTIIQLIQRGCLIFVSIHASFI